MNIIHTQLTTFFEAHSPLIIVNTSTNRALLCLRPHLELTSEGFFDVRFESLNDHGGNSVKVKAVLSQKEDALYIENEEENVLMFQALSLANYHHYIQSQYGQAPDFKNLSELVEYVNAQV